MNVISVINMETYEIERLFFNEADALEFISDKSNYVLAYTKID